MAGPGDHSLRMPFASPDPAGATRLRLGFGQFLIFLKKIPGLNLPGAITGPAFAAAFAVTALPRSTTIGTFFFVGGRLYPLCLQVGGHGFPRAGPVAKRAFCAPATVGTHSRISRTKGAFACIIPGSPLIHPCAGTHCQRSRHNRQKLSAFHL